MTLVDRRTRGLERVSRGAMFSARGRAFRSRLSGIPAPLDEKDLNTARESGGGAV